MKLPHPHLFLLCIWILSGCASVTNIPTQTALPVATNTPASTSTATASTTPSPIPTITLTPTPTMDPETAAKIKAIRAAVGDSVEDWVIYHGDSEPSNGQQLDIYEIKMVYAGEDPTARDKEIYNGLGQAIGKIKVAYKGQILIGDELRELTFPYYHEDYSASMCRKMGYNFFDCSKLDDHFLQPEMTVERTGTNYWNAVPGQVISVYLVKLGANGGNFTEFNNSFWTGQDDLFTALVENGDTSIGTIVPPWYRKVCDINNQRNVPYLCYENPIIIPGY